MPPTPNHTDDLFSFTPNSPRHGAPQQPAPCLVCKAFTPNPTGLCSNCTADPCARLDRLEQQTIRYEAYLMDLHDWLDRRMREATAADRHRAADGCRCAICRYTDMNTKIRASVSDPALYARINAGITAQIERGGALGVLLAAMRAVDARCLRVSAALDRIRLRQSAILRYPAAADWSPSDEATHKRRALGTRADNTAAAIRQMRMEEG